MIIHDGKAYFEAGIAAYGSGGIDGVSQIVTIWDYAAVRDDVVRGIMDVVGGGSDLPSAALGLAAHHVGIEAAASFDAVKTLAHLRARGIEAVASGSMRILPALQAGREVPPGNYVRMMRAGPPRQKVWRAPLRWLRASFLDDGLSRYPFGGADPRRHIHCLVLNELIHAHAKATSERVVYRPPHHWLDAATAGPRPIPSRLLDAAVERIDQAFQRRGADFSLVAAHLRAQVSAIAGYSLHHLEHVLARPEMLPKRFWTGAGSWPWARILRHAVRLNGGEVTGHDHGAGGAHVASPYKPMMEFEDCDLYATFSREAGKRLIGLADPALLMQSERPRLVVPAGACAGAELPVRRNRVGPATATGGPLRVFLLTALTSAENRTLKPRPTPLLRNDYTVRLLAGLVARGYDVTLKPHPADMEILPQQVLRDLGVRLETAPIETILGDADVIINNAHQSTSFASILLGGAAVVSADLHTDALTDEGRALMSRRCGIIDPQLTDDKRYLVDMDRVAAAIDAALERNDPAFEDIFFRQGAEPLP